MSTQLLLAIAQTCCRLVVLSADRRVLFFDRLRNLRAQTRKLVGITDVLHAHTGCRLIHEIDRLVRQTAIRDVALREAHRRTNGGILDARTVELLVFTAQTEENLFRVLLARLLHHNSLEAARECTVLGKMLLVLAECRRTDDLHFPTRKGGLQNIRRVQ